MRRTTPPGGLSRGCPVERSRPLPHPFSRVPPREKGAAAGIPGIPACLLKKADGEFYCTPFCRFAPWGPAAEGGRRSLLPSAGFSTPCSVLSLAGALAPLDLSGRPGRRHASPSTTGSLRIPPPLLLAAASPYSPLTACPSPHWLGQTPIYYPHA